MLTRVFWLVMSSPVTGWCADQAATVAAAATAAPGAPGGILGWAIGIVMSLGGASVLAWAIKRWGVPRYAAAVKAMLLKGLQPDTKDPELNRLLRAHFLTGVHLAEYMIPDRGKGADRFALVDRWMAKANIPAPIRKLLIEEAVWTMDDNLKTAAATASPAQPPAP